MKCYNFKVVLIIIYKYNYLYNKKNELIFLQIVLIINIIII